jgi:hypothetical protein
MNKFKYEVRWDSDVTTEYGKPLRYQQVFETLEEARLALAIHNDRNSELVITITNK